MAHLVGRMRGQGQPRLWKKPFRTWAMRPIVAVRTTESRTVARIAQTIPASERERMIPNGNVAMNASGLVSQLPASAVVAERCRISQTAPKVVSAVRPRVIHHRRTKRGPSVLDVNA